MRAQLAIINRNGFLFNVLLAVNNNIISAQMQVIPAGNGLNLSKFNDFQTLLNAAEAYYYLGYSVIPLLGDFDPDRPKVAARAWTGYQDRLALPNEFNDWFSPQGGAAALGIVTGRISRLVVLDFDLPDLFTDFRLRFPDLLETRTVKSAGRGLPHLYFHLPAYLHLASQKREGVDLLSDGRYVVAPPSAINEVPYRITRGGMPRPLNQYDLTRIQSFLASLKPASLYKEEPLPPASDSRPYYYGLSVIEPAKVADVGSRWGSNPPASVASVKTVSALLPSQSTKNTRRKKVRPPLPTRAALHGLYYYWCTQGGRNDALFRAALYARDHGMNETQTRHSLVSLYVSTPCLVKEKALKKKTESPALRQREAYATIRSAFSRPPRKIDSAPSLDGRVENGLPNTIREALLQLKLTCVVRTLEGLYQAGFRPGIGFTTNQILKDLKGVVGRDSIYNALNALAPNGQPFFPQRSPSALPPASNEAARQNQPLKTKKCFFVTEKKSGIKKRGPKERRFKFPTVAQLCMLLGVKPSSSDPLTRKDLTSAHQTRMALHRELIKRRPAEYTYRWLAHRLGVSRRTLSTYNRLIPIHSQPTYHETALSWNNVNSLLNDEILAGSHIETLPGKKYPALRSIACRLLAKGTYIRLKQRKGNFYWYGSDNPPPNVAPIVSSAPSLVYGGGSGWGLSSASAPSPSVGTRHTMSVPTPSPASLSTQWRGVGGEDIPSVGTRHAVSAPAVKSSPSVGKGLRPSHALPSPSIETQPTVSVSAPSPTPLSMQWRGTEGEDISPRPEGEGLGVRVSPSLPPDQQETLAQTIYQHVNQSTDGTSRHLSLKNARKLVRTYAEKDIQFALQRLSQRTNLANPTGFFVTVLRSTARANQL